MISLRLKYSDLLNFADDNTTAVTCKSIKDLPRTQEKWSESAVDWFEHNCMIENPDKF